MHFVKTLGNKKFAFERICKTAHSSENITEPILQAIPGHTLSRYNKLYLQFIVVKMSVLCDGNKIVLALVILID